MRITSKGQVTIPQSVRQQLGLHPHTEVEFVVQRGHAVLRRKKGAPTRGEQLVKHLRDRGAGKMIMSSKELLALLRDEPDELDAR